MSEQSIATDAERQEIWKPVVGFPAYQISNFGRIKSCFHINGWKGMTSNWRLLKPQRGATGYRSVILRNNYKPKTKYIHRLVLEAFIGPCPDGMECCHADGCKANNNLSNLRWDTQDSNVADKFKHGTQPMGETCGLSKLTESDVLEMREMRKSGLPYHKIAKKFGVVAQTARRAILRISWKCI